MKPELRALFEIVADLAPAERIAHYDSHSTPQDLRDELESLLTYDHTTYGASLLNDVVAGAAANWAQATSVADPVLRSCGPYTLVRLLGRGGMGEVWLAERSDGELTLQAAIKFVNPAVVRSGSFEQRFLRERQILASLSHPGIARILDAGRNADDGLPYLVMEYVDGLAIHEYCEGLSLESTLRVFLDVCDVVAHLHRNLVVHRDLKPSNIMVDHTSRVKLLDFGIAKVLDEVAADAAVTREVLLTPDYASPEQSQGQATTTASDIYSLGAVLRTLVGLSSTGSASLREDASVIAAKCLREEPTERYGSVDELSLDIQAALESRPVRAREGNRWYLFRRFFRRNWVITTAVAGVILMLAGSVYIVNRERLLAEQRFGQLRQLANTVFTLDTALRDLPGATKTREEVVTASLAYLDGLATESLRDDPALAQEVANGYSRIGKVQGSPRNANLGKFEQAYATIEKSIRIRDLYLAARPNDVEAIVAALDSAADLAAISDFRDRPDLLESSARLVALYGQRAQSLPGVTGRQKEAIAAALTNVGLAHSNLSRREEAAKYLEAALPIAREAQAWRVLLHANSTLAAVRRRLGDFDAALARLAEAEDLLGRVKFPNERARFQTEYAHLTFRSNLLGEDESISLGRYEEAIPLQRQAIALTESWIAKDTNDAAARDMLGKTSRTLGDMLRHVNMAEALRIYEKGESTLASLNTASAQRDRARLLAKMALPLRRLGRTKEAAQRLAQSEAILKKMGFLPPPKDGLEAEVSGYMLCLGQHELETGRPADAKATYEQLVAWMQERKLLDSPRLDEATSLSRIYLQMFQAYLALKDQASADRVAAKARAIWDQWSRKLPGNVYVERRRREMETVLSQAAKS
ncbi:hypothetical protein F183_A30850 [Bryobacterales bacterium F-183]|nr:hypothetical protein F183_A30850 [Bryobacterales bacterium F-183]